MGCCALVYRGYRSPCCLCCQDNHRSNYTALQLRWQVMYLFLWNDTRLVSGKLYRIWRWVMHFRSEVGKWQLRQILWVNSLYIRNKVTYVKKVRGLAWDRNELISTTFWRLIKFTPVSASKSLFQCSLGFSHTASYCCIHKRVWGCHSC